MHIYAFHSLLSIFNYCSDGGIDSEIERAMPRSTISIFHERFLSGFCCCFCHFNSIYDMRCMELCAATRRFMCNKKKKHELSNEKQKKKYNLTKQCMWRCGKIHLRCPNDVRCEFIRIYIRCLVWETCGRHNKQRFRGRCGPWSYRASERKQRHVESIFLD